jgi:hypothetical protein
LKLFHSQYFTQNNLPFQICPTYNLDLEEDNPQDKFKQEEKKGGTLGMFILLFLFYSTKYFLAGNNLSDKDITVEVIVMI